jgi:DNA polymerase III subunit delta
MKALRPALQDKQFSPAYYLHGDDEFLKEEALRLLIEAAVDQATRDFNLDQRKGADVDAAALAALLATPPMMAERRVVVVRDAPGLRKDSKRALEAYLESPVPDMLVLLTAPADAKDEKVLMERAVSVNCKPLTGVQVPKWISARAEKHLGTTITSAALDLLQATVGSDLTELALALDKLAAYCNGQPIDEGAVSAVVGVNREETPGRLLDAVAMRDSALAVTLIPAVLRQPKTGAVPMVMALTTQTLALAIRNTREFPASRQRDEYYSLLKRGSSNLTGRAWGETIDSWMRANGKWSTDDLDHALEVLLQADLSLKTSRVSSDEQILASAVLSICGGPAMRDAA